MNLNFVDVIVKAGEILLEGLYKNLKANYKGKSDIVTEIDLKSEAFLKEELLKIFNGYKIVAEETENKLVDASRVIYIDPLDGTTNYYHKFPFLPFLLLCIMMDRLLRPLYIIHIIRSYLLPVKVKVLF